MRRNGDLSFVDSYFSGTFGEAVIGWLIKSASFSLRPNGVNLFGIDHAWRIRRIIPITSLLGPYKLLARNIVDPNDGNFFVYRQIECWARRRTDHFRIFAVPIPFSCKPAIKESETCVIIWGRNIFRLHVYHIETWSIGNCFCVLIRPKVFKISLWCLWSIDWTIDMKIESSLFECQWR